MPVTLQVENTNLQSFLHGEDTKNLAMLREWQQQGSRETENMMRIFSPFRSGKYWESVGSRFTPKGFTTYPNVSYAQIVESGSRPHIIRPRTAKSLRWFGTFGKPIFAKQVHHPGTKGQFVVKRTAEQMRQVLRQLYAFIWGHYH